jgi:hypothetical protein
MKDYRNNSVKVGDEVSYIVKRGEQGQRVCAFFADGKVVGDTPTGVTIAPDKGGKSIRRKSNNFVKIAPMA